MTETAPRPAHKTFDVSAPALARVRSNRRITPLFSADVRHIVLDTSGIGYNYVEGQALGVVVPGTGSPGGLPRLKYYSIASSRSGDDGLGQSLSVCVKRVVEPEGTPSSSGSHYLCDLEEGSTVALVGPYGPTFPLPSDPATPLILAAAGTGIAPFRGLLAAMYRDDSWQGPVRLYHGVRTSAEALYRTELERYASQPHFQIRHAFSREGHAADGHPCRIHHLMASDAPDLLNLLLHHNARLYICGVRGLEDTVESALASSAGSLWPSLKNRLLAEGRLRVSTS